MKAKKPKTEKVVYAGRIWNGGDVLQRFVRANGQERFFQGVKGVWIGSTYECTEDGIAARPKRLDFPTVDHPEWEAEDGLVERELHVKRAEAKVKALEEQPHMKAAVKALEPLCKGLGYFHRRALIELLVQKTAKK